MIHEITIKWHDLLEDPTDLPTKEDNYHVTLMNLETKELDLYGDAMDYQVGYGVWHEVYDDGYGDYGGEAYFKSYGQGETKWTGDDLNAKWVVVAWAAYPEHYIPQKLQGS